MFGPLNGVRIALVSAAAVTALVAAGLGYPLVSAVLLAGVAGHGLGWWILWRRHRSSA